MPTPTPDLNADLPQWGISNEPVPDVIRQATGATTWEEVLAWMDGQAASAGLGVNVAGSIEVVISESGEVTSVELVKPANPPGDPPVTPGPPP